MWVTNNVEIDDRLVEALRDGRMVIFVGAGVSMGAPTNLPGFESLATELGADARVERHEHEFVERYLGRVADSGFPLHAQTAARIEKAEESNRLHTALIDLARVGNAIRIVTTNFDLHLSLSAREAEEGDIPEYFAPALPLGDDFEGIVYLHGAVGRDPHRLVLTDTDFSRAYITRGWARQFLLDLFGKWPVLFVGFSHNDTILTYLARGLSPGTKRFALVQEEDASRFQALDVNAIVFPTASGDDPFEPLTNAIAEWARLASMGLIKHEERVRELTATAPPQTQPELDYARSVINNPERTPFFTKYARSVEWLAWAAEEPIFQRLFEGGRRDDLSVDLAVWFAEKFVIEEPAAALGVLYERGGHMSLPLWRMVAHRLWTGGPSIEVRARWIPHLLAAAPDDTADYLEYLLVRSSEEERVTPLLLFEYLTEPRVVSQPDLFSDELIGSVGPSIKIRGDLHWLFDAWKRIFRPRLGSFASSMLQICSSHLEKVARLSASFELAGSGPDSSSMLRPSIPASEDEGAYRRWSDLLVDVARESMYWAMDHDELTARRTVDAWLSSAAPLLRRLGIHMAERASWLSSAEKLRLVLDRDLLFDKSAGPETRSLIRSAVDDSDAVLVRELLAKVDDGPPGVDEPFRADIPRQRLLLAIREGGKEVEAIDERLAKIATEHPELATAPEPDVPTVNFTEWAGPGSPKSVDDLLGVAADDPELLEFLLSYDETGWERNREGLLRTVYSAARRDFGWSFELMKSLAERVAWDNDIAGRVIGAWSDVSFSVAEWTAILDLLQTDAAKASHAYEISDILDRGLRDGGGGLPLALLDRAECLAESVWEATRAKDDTDDPAEDDWLGRAINRAAGKLTLFLVRALSERKSAEGLSEIPEPSKSVFEQALSQETLTDRLGAVVLVSQAHFLHALDREWVRTCLLDAFDWDKDASAAKRSWSGFLSWGRLPPPLIEDLMPRYLQTASHLPELEQLRHRFHEQLAVIALRDQQPSDGRGWIDEFISCADPEDVAGFTRAATFLLRDLSEEFRQRAWDEWLQSYWEKRINALPRPMGEAEAREIVGWAIVIGDRAPEAIPLAIKGDSGGAYDLFFHDLQETNLASEHPQLVASLFLHAVGKQGEPFYHCTDASELVNALISTGSVEKATQDAMREQLLRLHCP